MAEGGRGVAESDITKRGRRTWVSRSGNVKGLKGSKLLRVEGRGGRRRQWGGGRGGGGGEE